MSFPTFADEVALASLPFDTPQVWTDLSARTRLRSWSRGRQTETVRPDTGRSSTVFENTDRALDPENTASAYYPNVLPMRRVRATASVRPLMTNLCTNPSFETNLLESGTAWTAFSGVGTVSRDNAHSKYGSWAMKFIGAGAGAGPAVGINTPEPVTAGLTYTISYWIFGAGGEQLKAGLAFFNAAWANLSGWVGTNVTLVPGWQRVSFTSVATAGATQWLPRIQALTGTSYTYWVDGIQIEQAAAATAYCDGDQPGCEWTGTPHASTSTVTTYYLFTHFVDPLQGWQITQDSPGYAEVTAVANDGFDVLATAQFTELDSFPQQTAAARITAILDLFSWPAAERSIDVSDTAEIQAAVAGTLTGQTALDQIQAASDTEDGVFYIDGRGYATFHSRYYSLLNARAVTSQATFCDLPNLAGGSFLYTSLTPSQSPIVNDYLVTRAGGTQIEALDSVSEGLYRTRSVTLDTLHLTNLEAVDFARYKVIATRDSHRRYDEMTITPGDDDAVWLQVFQREIGDRITVVWSPPGGGAADVRDMFIEAVSFNVGPGVEASVTYRLSPGSQVTGWVLGDAIQGVLGSSTFLRY